MTTMTTVFSPAKLKAARTGRKMSRFRLAVAVGLAEATVLGYEVGKSNPSVGALSRISDVLGCGVGDFFEEHDRAHT
jgi:transcriptional regulator with XRE-family HTH domain